MTPSGTLTNSRERWCLAILYMGSLQMINSGDQYFFFHFIKKIIYGGYNITVGASICLDHSVLQNNISSYNFT